MRWLVAWSFIIRMRMEATKWKMVWPEVGQDFSPDSMTPSGRDVLQRTAGRMANPTRKQAARTEEPSMLAEGTGVRFKVEYLRLTSLGVIGALVKNDSSEVINFLQGGKQLGRRRKTGFGKQAVYVL